ncbi:hypothetical protein M569_03621 [Genlisea aurea]|uniref:PUM-HD domain-containing protein n=1 Tax=Genlisea aurea TaxID=192259 RepID=S8E5Q6_9LAMI|nr:hypothetical protein M569_03621 [Genlisea aurea]
MERHREFDRAVQRPRSSSMSSSAPSSTLTSQNSGYRYDPFGDPPDYGDCLREIMPEQLTRAYELLRFDTVVCELLAADGCTRRSNIHRVIEFVPKLLTGERDFYLDIFDELVDESHGDRLEKLVHAVLHCAPLCEGSLHDERKGVKSMCRFIRNLKKTKYGNAVSKVLSTHLDHVKNCYGFKKIITECLKTFTSRDNEPIFEKIVSDWKEICVYREGSIFLQQNIIPRISGHLRKLLLKDIAESTIFLAQEPFGNYIVSRILQLDNEEVNMIVYRNLQSRCTFLSTVRGSSNVIEGCMESSLMGLKLVVHEFLSAPLKTLIHIAKDDYGNFVLQKALRICKNLGLEHLFDCFVKLLKPHEADLIRNRSGRCVVTTFRELDPLKWGY